MLPSGHLAKFVPTALGLVLLGCSPLSCNSLWGVDQLSFDGSTTAVGGSGAGGSDGGAGGATGPVVHWLQRFGGTGSHAVTSLAAGDAGDVAVAGFSDGPIAFGPETLPEGGDDDIVLFQLDRAGEHQWSARFGQAGDQWANDVAFHDDGNVLLAGHFSGNVDFGQSSFAAASNVHGCTARFEGQGNERWAVAYAGPVASTTAVARTGAGSTLVGGDFTGITWFDSNVTKTATGGQDAFVGAHALDGTLLWVTQMGGALNEKTMDLTTGDLGRVIAVGYFDGTLAVEGAGDVLQGSGTRDAFVVWLNVDGSPHAAYNFGNAGYAMARGVASNGDSEVVVVGQFDDRITLGTETFTTQGGQDLFVVKLAATGEVTWAHAFGGPNDEQASAVALTAEGTIWVAGSAVSDVDFGGGVLPKQGAEDVVVFALAPNGDHEFSIRGGDHATQRATAIAVSGDDVFVGGYFGGTLELGDEVITAQGDPNMFVLQIGPQP